MGRPLPPMYANFDPRDFPGTTVIFDIVVIHLNGEAAQVL